MITLMLLACRNIFGTTKMTSDDKENDPAGWWPDLVIPPINLTVLVSALNFFKEDRVDTNEVDTTLM